MGMCSSLTEKSQGSKIILKYVKHLKSNISKT